MALPIIAQGSCEPAQCTHPQRTAPSMSSTMVRSLPLDMVLDPWRPTLILLRRRI